MLKAKVFFVFILVFTITILAFDYFTFWKPSTPESLQLSTETTNEQKVTEADRQKIMQDIGPNATEETKQEYLLIAKRLAQESESITIKDCKGSPMVLKATPGKTVRLTNQDAKGHQIILESGKYKYTVPASSSTDIQFNFFRGKGFYSYGCDRGTGPAGILYVAE